VIHSGAAANWALTTPQPSASVRLRPSAARNQRMIVRRLPGSLAIWSISGGSQATVPTRAASPAAGPRARNGRPDRRSATASPTAPATSNGSDRTALPTWVCIR
jgi:hypothetical protein